MDTYGHVAKEVAPKRAKLKTAQVRVWVIGQVIYAEVQDRTALLTGRHINGRGA